MTEEEKIGFTTALEVAKQAIAKMPYAMSEEIEEGHEQAYRAIQALTDSDPVSEAAQVLQNVDEGVLRYHLHEAYCDCAKGPDCPRCDDYVAGFYAVLYALAEQE